MTLKVEFIKLMDALIGNTLSSNELHLYLLHSRLGYILVYLHTLVDIDLVADWPIITIGSIADGHMELSGSN